MTLGAGTESALITSIAFWVIAASSIIAAIAVVQLRDLFRAALFLVVSFLGVAGMFVLLRAEFLAVVQVLIYVGAISVLIIFAILMTRDIEQGSPSNRIRIPALALAFLFFLAITFVAVNTKWELLDERVPVAEASERFTSISGEVLDEAKAKEVERELEKVYSNTIPKVASLLLTDFVLAFEAASVLLLAAVIGALALVRER